MQPWCEYLPHPPLPVAGPILRFARVASAGKGSLPDASAGGMDGWRPGNPFLGPQRGAWTWQSGARRPVAFFPACMYWAMHRQQNPSSKTRSWSIALAFSLLDEQPTSVNIGGLSLIYSSIACSACLNEKSMSTTGFSSWVFVGSSTTGINGLPGQPLADGRNTCMYSNLNSLYSILR